MRFVATVTLLGLFAGSAAAQPHDATWAQRKIDEAQCRTWALDQARAEYGPQLRQAARQQESMISAGRYSGSAAQAGVGLAGANIALLQLAQQGREKELFEACMIQQTSQRERITAPVAPRQTPQVPERTTPVRPKEPCAWGLYWNSTSGQCEKF